MSELWFLLRIGWPLFITGLSGLVLQLLALLRARRQPLVSILVSGLGLLALLVACYLMVQDRWESATNAVSGADPASRQEMLAMWIPSRLGSLQVFFFGALLLLLQAPIGAVAIGLAWAKRARARAGAAVGVALTATLLTVVPLCVGVVLFALRWERIFGAIAAVDPARRIPILLAAMTETRSTLTTGAVASAVGLLVSCVLVLVLLVSLRRGRAAGDEPEARRRPVAVALTVAICVAAALGLWLASRSYVLPAPAGGPVKRFLQATELPFDLVRRLQQDPQLAFDLTHNISLGDDLHPPRSTTSSRCVQAVEVMVTRRGILVEGEEVAAVKGGQVDAAVKRDGASGYLIEPLAAQLRKHATRLKKIEEMTDGKMRFMGRLQLIIDQRTPYRLVSEVLYTAGEAGMFRHQLVTLAERQPYKRRTVLRCIEAFRPRYLEQGTEHVQRGPCDLVVAQKRDERRELAVQKVERKPRGPKPRRKKLKRKPPPTPPPGRSLPKPGHMLVSLSYSGFIVADEGEMRTALDGTLPTVKCARPLEDKRCPVRLDPETGEWIDGYDYRALQHLVKKIKARHPKERCVIVSADRRIPFHAVIRTLDALRGEASGECTLEGGCLFDRAVLSAGVQ